MKEMFIDLAKYRIQRAFENRTDAILLLKSDEVNDSVNRLFQANYYAVKSLLATKMKDSTKQQRVLHIFQENFVQTGEVPAEYSHIVERSYRHRDEGESHRYGKRDRSQREPMMRRLRLQGKCPREIAESEHRADGSQEHRQCCPADAAGQLVETD